jgi:ABC-type sugar transport system permease subunit
MRAQLLAVPLLAYLALLLAYPMVHAVRLALTDPPSGTFPSLENFRVLADDALFWRALATNVVFPLAAVTLELVAGIGLALLLAARVGGRRLLRAVVVVPFALPEVAFLAIMRYVLAPHGYANAVVSGLGAGPVDWLRPGSTLAFVTVVCVDAWHMTPVVFLIVLAGLAAIPAELDEAARLDGAPYWQRLRRVTLPLLRPAVTAAVLLRGVDAVRCFATPLVLAGVEGVPVLSTYAYHQWSDYGNDGAAAAAAIVLGLVAMLASVPLVRRRVMV